MTWPNDSDPPSQAALRAERENPVVLVIRDPDARDEILLFGLPEDVRVEYLDLGYSFDIRHFSESSRFDASDWVESHLDAIARLPPLHRARWRIEQTIERVCDRFRLNPHGSLME